MNKESKLNLNAGDYAISHCDSDKTYNGLEVHKMLCDAYIAGSNDTFDDVDKDEKIKNKLINLIKMSSEVGGLALHKWEADEMLAWLEKQGDYANFRDKAQVGDRITKNEDGVLVNLSQLKRMAKPREKQGEQKASYTTIVETGDGGINALVTRELPTDGCDDEQKPFDYENANIHQKDFAPKDEPKFKVGDWVVNKLGNVWHIDSFDKENYQVSNGNGYNYFPISKQNEMRLWTIKDAKSGDIIYTPKGCGVEGIFLIEGWKKVEDIGRTLCSDIGYRVEDDEIIAGGLGAIWWEGVIDPFYPATKEQRDLLFQKMNEAGYTFDFENKKLKKIEPKTKENKRNVGGISPNWSEEDDMILSLIVNSLKFIRDTLSHDDKYTVDVGSFEGQIEWLQSIQDRVQPQPKQEWSEEDKYMYDILCGTIENTDINENTKYKLISWLKSIKPQNTYNPYKAVVESIAAMVEKYAPFDSNLQDFYDNVKVKCKDAKEYDKMFPQAQWKPSDEQMHVLRNLAETSIGFQHSKTLISLYDDLKKL